MSQYFENDKNIKSELRLLDYRCNGYNFSFYSDNGVFSKNEIDYGTKLLLNTYLSFNKDAKNVLDVGAGLGVISIVLSKVTNSICEMVEVNDRAIELSNRNIKYNHVEKMVSIFKSDAYENVNKKYDCIITNPPIRAGKKIVYKILLESINYLNENGELWFVMRKNHGALTAKRDVESVFGNCEIIEKDKGFFIIKARKI